VQGLTLAIEAIESFGGSFELLKDRQDLYSQLFGQLEKGKSHPEQDPKTFSNDAGFLRALIEAEMSALQRADLGHANYVNRRIHLLVLFERLAPALMPREEREKKAVELLNQIAGGKAGRSHDVWVLDHQYNFLVHFLKAYEYPEHAPGRRWAWLKEHWSLILKAISAWPCLCTYHSEIGPMYDDREYETTQVDANELNSVTVVSCDHTRPLLLLILAHLHGTTPRQIENLLLPSSK
jgi:hypothetical protein